MATFNWTPTYGSRATYRPRVRVVKFSDGYEQRQADGLNPRAATWDLTFDNRTQTEAGAIEAFLQARNAVEAFDWTPPYEASAIRVVCRDWSKSIDTSNAITLTAQFAQVFEP